MQGYFEACFRPWVCLVLVLAGVVPGVRAELEAPGEGRFLYAGDDDWDWASPLGRGKPCKLSDYGTMSWSALDWAEEGLREVRGVLVGMPPMVGNYLTMEELSGMRGEHTSYRDEKQGEGVIVKLLAADRPPNLILLTQLSQGDGRLGEADLRALAGFLKGGGRLLVLDDSSCYSPLLAAVVEAALALAKAGKVPPDPEVVDAALVARVGGLVEALGSPEFRTRESATDELRKLGMQAVREAEKIPSNDPEVRSRIARVRSELIPAGGLITNESRKDKQESSTKRVGAAAAKLRGSGFPCETATIYADGEGAALAALKVILPAP